MLLGGGDGSKPSVSFLNLEPKVSKFPPTSTETVLVFSPRRPLSSFSSLSLALLIFYRLATDIGSVEQAFCVLFAEFVVDDVLAIFDGVCCGNQHVNTSSV